MHKTKLIDKLLASSTKEDLKKIASELHPVDIAEALETIEEDKQKGILSLFDVPVASRVILEMSEQAREGLIDAIDHDHLLDIVEVMESDDAADIIGDLPKKEADTLLNELNDEESEELRKLLQHEPDTAGGIMQTELFAIREGMLIEDGIVQYIASAEQIKDVHVVYIIDAFGKLSGSLNIGELMRHKPSTPITEIMDKNIITVKTSVDQEEVARLFKKYDVVSLPVLDNSDMLIGRILVDDVVDVLDKEASEDMLRIAGIYDNESVLDSPLKSVRMRFPWLVLNLGTATLAASIIGVFEQTINSLVVLAVFMPIVAGMGGNAGTQALAVTIRGLALGQLESQNAKKAILKGLWVGAMNGLIVGILMGIITYVWEGKILLAGIMFVAMLFNIIIANMFGIAIPLFLKWIKVDPAIASSVFLTSLTDSLGFLSFLGMASFFIDRLQ